MEIVLYWTENINLSQPLNRPTFDNALQKTEFFFKCLLHYILQQLIQNGMKKTCLSFVDENNIMIHLVIIVAS